MMMRHDEWADLAYRAVADPIGLESSEAHQAATRASRIWATLDETDRTRARQALTDRIVHGVKTLIETTEGLDHE